MPATETVAAAHGSVIHDIGYQRYAGARLGRGYATRSLYVHGTRTAFALGRSAKAKIFPWFLAGVLVIAAVVIGAVESQIQQEVMSYAQFADNMSWLIIFFLAAITPELVSRDLRSGVLPLYFSRPLHPRDYALAKLGATVTAVLLLLGVPQLIMFLIAAFGAGDMSGVWDEFLDLLPGLAYAAMWAALLGSIALLVASLAGRRAFAAGGVVAVFLVSTPVVGVLSVVPSETANDLAGLASPMSLVHGVGAWLFRDQLYPPGAQFVMGGDYGAVYGAVFVALVAGAVLLLLARYRKVARS